MTDAEVTHPAGGGAAPQEALVDTAKRAVQAEGLQAQIYRAISVQRPVVLDYLKSLRREKPTASAAEMLKELDRRYVVSVAMKKSPLVAR
jgi:hypothetical protein